MIPIAGKSDSRLCFYHQVLVTKDAAKSGFSDAFNVYERLYPSVHGVTLRSTLLLLQLYRLHYDTIGCHSQSSQRYLAALLLLSQMTLSSCIRISFIYLRVASQSNSTSSN